MFGTSRYKYLRVVVVSQWLDVDHLITLKLRHVTVQVKAYHFPVALGLPACLIVV